jgi:hypothetical protein
MAQEQSVSEPQGEDGHQPRAEGGDGYQPLAEGEESLEAMGGTGIELLHNSVTPLTMD